MAERQHRGSEYLGRELRRLRGKRSLEQVARLSASLKGLRGAQPLSKSTLSQLELGTAMPSAQTLRTLSVLYRVSAEQLLDFIAEEQAAAANELPETLAATEQAWEESLGREAWAEALALAAHAEALASQPASRLNWRANRANALHMVGLHQHALSMLLECVHADATKPQSRFKMLRTLAEVYASVGHLDLATRVAKWATEEAPNEITPTWRWGLAQTQVRLVLLANDHAQEADARSIREALANLDAAQAAMDDQPRFRLQAKLWRAVGQKLLGNELLAARDLQSLVSEARDAGLPHLQSSALANLGILRRQQKKWDAALEALRAAETIAVGEQFNDDAFEIYFEMYLTSRERQDGQASGYLERCAQYHPIIQTRTPRVLEYESLLAAQQYR